jgi:hypothetical protein
MEKIPRTKLHLTNFNHDAFLTTLVGCGSSSNIENLQHMNEGPQ